VRRPRRPPLACPCRARPHAMPVVARWSRRPTRRRGSRGIAAPRGCDDGPPPPPPGPMRRKSPSPMRGRDLQNQVQIALRSRRRRLGAVRKVHMTGPGVPRGGSSSPRDSAKAPAGPSKRQPCTSSDSYYERSSGSRHLHFSGCGRRSGRLLTRALAEDDIEQRGACDSL
jgi:hypothetical protein